MAELGIRNKELQVACGRDLRAGGFQRCNEERESRRMRGGGQEGSTQRHGAQSLDLH